MTPDFSAKKVLVIGDTIIDINTYGKLIGISAETPTPVFRADISDSLRGSRNVVSFGGAALVVRNLLELGAQVDFLTLYGSGSYAHIQHTFNAPNLKVHAVIDESRPVTVKHRYWADGYKLFQVDTRDDSAITDASAQEAIRLFDRATNYTLHDAIVIADYRHGFLTPILARCFSETPTPTYVASQVSQAESNHNWYSDGAFLIMNQLEYNSAKLKNNERPKIITRGAIGSQMTPRRTDASVVRVACPAIEVEAVDTSGAGDAFLAAYALSEDQPLANTWAGLSCTVKGANPPTRKMLEDWYAARK